MIQPSPLHITIDRLRTLLGYDAQTGELTYLSGPMAGRKTSHGTNSGYRRASVDGVVYRAHRIAWALHYGEWPTFIVDHINQNKADNRITNLRRASSSLNNHNRPALPNKFGLAGVRQSRNKTHFQSSIAENGKRRYLGTFPTAAEAHAAYTAARNEIMANR